MDDDAIRFRKGIKLLKQGKLEEAVAELEIAATTGIDLPVEHFALAVAYASKGESIEAIAEFERYLSMDPKDDTKIAYAKKKLARLRGKTEKTRELPTEQRHSGVPVDAEPETTRADKLLAEGRIDDAIELFEHAVRNTPSSAAWCGLGKATYRKGLKVALASFEKAVSLDAKNTAACFNAGAVAELLGETAKASRYFELVVAAHPDDREAAARLAALGT